MSRARWRGALRVALVLTSVSLVAVGSAHAHGGSLRAGASRAAAVPAWLFLATGGGVVGASFLLASFATDRAFVRRVAAYHRTITTPEGLSGWGTAAGGALGVIGLGLIIVVGLVGPPAGVTNAGVLLVWVGWWAGFTIMTYTVGNSWPAVNPYRTIAGWLPSFDRPYPERLGAWPAVAGLVVLIWIEVVSPLADDPRLLASVVTAYGILALVGATYFGGDRYFGRIDPLSKAFRYYGAVAPLARNATGGLRFRLPGAGLQDPTLVRDGSDVAFILALLWVTSYDGLVATPAWAGLLTPLVEAGVPAWLCYPVGLLAGFGLFAGLYRVAIARGRLAAESLLSAGTLARRFAPSLLAIAAGYHLAHYLGYFIELLPALIGALSAPLGPPAPVAIVLPGWYAGVELAGVLLGHILAIWVAHGVAFDLFPSRMQAIRSQFALTAVMVFYTMSSLWIVSQPYRAPPFL